MKMSLKLVRGFFVAALLGGLPAVLAQPAITVNPSVISNTYTGVITLNITGLTNSEKATVQQWLDLNGNGAIDPGEPMFDAFKIADGGAMVIGGVTNVSVPFDSNPASGAITTTINFAPPMTFENITARRIFQVVSPSGTATATLDVTNGLTGQTVTGTIYSNDVPFPNAVVVALEGNQGSYAGADVADGSGNYSLNLPTGTYTLVSTMPNFYVNQQAAPVVTLTNGMMATNNLYETNGVVAATGRIYDADTSQGLGGVMLLLQSGKLLSVAFTDTNGDFSDLVTSNFWSITPVKERLGRRAYLVTQAKVQADTTAGPATNDVAVYKGNALFYGRITDNNNNPLANIQFAVNDTSNLYSGKAYSTPDGTYGITAYADGTNVWSSDPGSGANLVLANDIVNTPVGTNVSSGQAVLQNFQALPITGYIQGAVHDNLGNPVAGVSLYALQSSDPYTYQSLNNETDTNGNYSLGVANGSWQVNFDISGKTLASLGLVDLYGPYSVSIPPTNALLDITVYPSGSSALTQPQFVPPHQFNFNARGSQGVNYTLEVSTNLGSTNWSPLYTFTLTNNPFPVTDSSATGPSRFYRLQKN